MVRGANRVGGRRTCQAGDDIGALPVISPEIAGDQV